MMLPTTANTPTKKIGHFQFLVITIVAIFTVSAICWRKSIAATGYAGNAAGQSSSPRATRRRKAQRKKALAKKKSPASAPSVVGLDLHSLSSDSQDNLWLGGSIFQQRGLLIRYDGIHFDARPFPEATWAIHKVQFTSPDWGWMLADWGHVYQTVNAGTTWKRAKLDFLGPQPRLETIEFYDSLNGWIGGYDGLIVHTNDAGKSWSTQVTPTHRRRRQNLALNGEGMASEDFPRILSSTIFQKLTIR
jgi:hypothetical protein